MKRLLFTSVLLIVSIFTFSQSTINWSNPVEVASSTFGNYHPRISLNSSGNPMILWGDNNENVQFARMIGSSFATPIKLNPTNIKAFSAAWAGPDIASKGDTVYAVYKTSTEDTGHVYIRTSYNGGASFSNPIRVENLMSSMNKSRFPTISVDAQGNPMVAFMKFDGSFGSAKWAVARSMNYGQSFMTDVNAGGYSGGFACDCCPGSIINSGNNAVMLYRDAYNNRRITWAGVSNDNGATFPSGMAIDSTNWMIMNCPSSGPDGIIVGDSLYTTFMSDGKVYFSKSSLTSMQFSSASQIEPTGNPDQNYPRIAQYGTKATLVWKQFVNGTGTISILFTDSIQKGFSKPSEVIATDNMNMLANADVAMSKDAIHIVWQDDMSDKVMYIKGTFSSLPTAAENFNYKHALRFYPNPASKFINFKTELAEVISVKILDISGRIIYVSSTPNDKFINIENIKNGLYFLHVKTKAATITEKLIIQH